MKDKLNSVLEAQAKQVKEIIEINVFYKIIYTNPKLKNKEPYATLAKDFDEFKASNAINNIKTIELFIELLVEEKLVDKEGNITILKDAKNLGREICNIGNPTIFEKTTDDNKVKNILKAITNDGIIRASLSSYDKVDTLIANKNGFFEDAYMLPEEPFDADHLLYVFSEAFMTLTVQNKYLDLMKSNSSDGSGPSQFK